jgi:hypothetical protein
VSKPILCLDFDGVVHRYDQPWTTADEIRDHATLGFFEWAEKAAEYFALVIYSSRSKDPGAISAMMAWMVAERKLWREQGGKSATGVPVQFEFAHVKPAAFLTIDDRAVCFDGDWSALELDPALLRGFKPWNKR